MRIAYLAQSYPPMISGASLFARQIAEAMAQRGHKVLVIAASDRNYPYLEQKENLCINRLESHRNPLRVGQRFLLYPRRSAMKALREFHPDIIHSHDPLQLGLLGIEYARRARIPIILTIHQLPWFVASYLPRGIRICAEAVLWLYARWLSRQFTALITPTQTISSLVSGLTGLPTDTVSYGLDLTAFRPLLAADDEPAARKKWNLPPRVPLLLHVGRLDTDKRVDRVVRAGAQTILETDAHLVVVGDGIQKTALVQMCVSLGIADRVHFMGYVSTEQGLPELYRIVSLFVTASEIETQGIVLLEAAASGLPLVAVRATCIPEIVHDGINGYLTGSGDVRAMSEAMISILADSRLAGSMGMESRKLAERHNIQVTIHRHEKLYRAAIRQARERGVAAQACPFREWWKRARSVLLNR